MVVHHRKAKYVSDTKAMPSRRGESRGAVATLCRRAAALPSLSSKPSTSRSSRLADTLQMRHEMVTYRWRIQKDRGQCKWNGRNDAVRKAGPPWLLCDS